jgi:hypothetical protein
VVLVAAPEELGGDVESAGGVDPGVAGAMLPVPDGAADGVDGLLMLPLVPLEDGVEGALLGDGLDDDGVGLDVSLLLHPYTVVSAATANAIEIGLRII